MLYNLDIYERNFKSTMSKKDIRKKFKGGEYFENGNLYQVGRWLKKYFATRTTKVKHKKQFDEE